MRTCVGLGITILFLNVATILRAEPFNMAELPVGASVTLPQPSTIEVPAQMIVRIGSTDMPQSLKMTSSRESVRIRLLDRHAKDVQKQAVHPGTPYFYTFSKLGKIDLEIDQSKLAGPLVLESNKPIFIERVR